MKLTKTLLSYLNRVFNKDPLPWFAIQLRYDGGMTWQVAEGIFTTSVTGGSGSNLTVDLSQYTLGTLIDFLAAQPGYTTPYADESSRAGLSALTLLDGSGDISQSNGDHLWAYSNVLWAYMEATAVELELARAQINKLPGEMATTTADTVWLDTLGSYYKVPRLPNEADGSYGPRMIAQVLRPASNNVALEAAIKTYTGQPAKVTDIKLYGSNPPLYNSDNVHDGVILYNAVNSPVYGLFDVTYGYDLVNGGDISGFQSIVLGLIENLRAAGTHLRSIALSGSTLADSLTPPTDGGALAFGLTGAWSDTLTAPTDTSSPMPVGLSAFADTLTPATDSALETVNYNYQYNGVRYHNGVILYQSGQSITESL